MREDRLDHWMKEAVQEEAKKIPVPDRKADIMRACREAGNMRKFEWKKAAGAVAILCVLCTGTALAGGKIASYMTGADPQKAVTSYEKVANLEKKTGIAGKEVKSFENGFQFKEANTSFSKGLDESGNTVTKFDELDFSYERDGKTVYLNLSPTDKDSEKPSGHETKYQEITLFYQSDNYKFVPVGYEPTEEEKEQMEKGELYISEGADQIETQTYTHVSWTEEHTKYLLSTFDGISEKELIKMAKELIENGN